MKRTQILIIVGVMSVVLMSSAALAEREDFESGNLLSNLNNRLKLAKEELSQVGTVLEKRSQEFLKLIDKEVEEGFVRLEAFTNGLDLQVEGLREDLNSVLSQENIQGLKDYFENFDQHVIDSIHDEIIVRIAGRLDMTPEQVEKLRPIFREELQKRHELLGQYLAQEEDQRDEFEQKDEALWQETLTRLDGKLTPEQLQELQTWRSELREKIRKVFSEKKELE